MFCRGSVGRGRRKNESSFFRTGILSASTNASSSLLSFYSLCRLLSAAHPGQLVSLAVGGGARSGSARSSSSSSGSGSSCSSRSCRRCRSRRARCVLELHGRGGAAGVVGHADGGSEDRGDRAETTRARERTSGRRRNKEKLKAICDAIFYFFFSRSKQNCFHDEKNPAPSRNGPAYSGGIEAATPMRSALF